MLSCPGIVAGAFGSRSCALIGRSARVAGWCRDIRPFIPGPHTFGSKPGETALVLAITAYNGVVRIAGLDVTYRAGLRQGSQNTGMCMYYRTTPRPR
jgi:hypothetical protein